MYSVELVNIRSTRRIPRRTTAACATRSIGRHLKYNEFVHYDTRGGRADCYGELAGAAGRQSRSQSLTITQSVPANPGAPIMLGLEPHGRRASGEDRDAVDLWTCMELLVASREIDEFRSSNFDDVREQVADDGPSTRNRERRRR